MIKEAFSIFDIYTYNSSRWNLWLLRLLFFLPLQVSTKISKIQFQAIEGFRAPTILHVYFDLPNHWLKIMPS